MTLVHIGARACMQVHIRLRASTQHTLHVLCASAFFFNSVWRGHEVALLELCGYHVSFLLDALAHRQHLQHAKPSAAPQVGHASKLQLCSRSRCPRGPPGSIMSLANGKAMCLGEKKRLEAHIAIIHPYYDYKCPHPCMHVYACVPTCMHAHV